MCNPAFHPLWKLIGKPAGIRNSATVWGIVSALQAADPILCALNDKGKVAVLAEWSGLKALQVALVLAGLQHYGIMVDGRIVLGEEHDETALIASERLNKTTKTFKTVSKTPVGERQRQLRAARNRRYYLKRKGLPGDEAAGDGNRLNQTPPSLEEKEQQSLFPSGAREQASRPAQGWGIQAEADKKARAERWLSNVTEYARDHMAQSDWAKLLEGAMAEPRPRWAQIELDEWSRRMKADKDRPPRRPDPQQPEMLMPIAPSRPSPAAGTRSGWDERWINYRRQVGG